MGTEESVSVLREGDICLRKGGDLVRVVGGEFPYAHESWVTVSYISGWGRESVRSDTLTRVDPAFYKLYGIEERDYESTTG